MSGNKSGKLQTKCVDIRDASALGLRELTQKYRGSPNGDAVENAVDSTETVPSGNDKSVSRALLAVLADLHRTGIDIFYCLVNLVPITEGHDKLFQAIKDKISSLPETSRVVATLKETQDIIIQQRDEAVARADRLALLEAKVVARGNIASEMYKVSASAMHGSGLGTLSLLDQKNIEIALAETCERVQQIMDAQKMVDLG